MTPLRVPKKSIEIQLKISHAIFFLNIEIETKGLVEMVLNKEGWEGRDKGGKDM